MTTQAANGLDTYTKMLVTLKKTTLVWQGE
jgi:hypothetical protein